MKRLAIFPYHPDIEIILKYRNFLNEFSLIGICSYKEDEILIESINREVEACKDMEQILERCDILLLTDNYRDYRIDKYYTILEKAVIKQKEILVSPRLINILNLEKYRGKIRLLQEDSNVEKNNEHIVEEDEMYEVSVPIIAVEGMGKNCSKFENQINLKIALENSGYRVKWISSNECAILFGGKCFPQILYSENCSFSQKVLQINHFLYDISIDEKPDVILLGIPEGITEFEGGEKNHFGEYALVIGSAVQIDSSILCLYYGDIDKSEGLKEIINYIEKRYFLPIDAISIGRNTYQIEDNAKEEISYLFLREDYLKKYSTKFDMEKLSIFRIWEKEEVVKANERIQEVLQENASTL